MTKPILNWFKLTAKQRCHILKAAEAYCTPNGAGSEEIASEMYYAVEEACDVEELEARQVASEDQVKVKPIVWYDKPDGQEVRIGRADNGDAYSVKCDFGTWGYTNRRHGAGFITSRLGGVSFIDEDDAISGANEDHERHILSALDISPTHPVTVQEAAKVLLSQTTIAEKKVMNEAGIDAMRPGGFTFADMVDFDTGRIAALRALSETDT
ncbi:hypothetical protein [Roseobacter sp. N2S]|uniref:hypothetical protein n=1 Tax=Roseobacter sp. N2S TaxID=2663844 RepID=UPI00286622B0|nr:hypothetical protein [Roseobacter sp. N2S]MDR6266568.1 hypothetical protein [Roseobacter sp. N2S]